MNRRDFLRAAAASVAAAPFVSAAAPAAAKAVPAAGGASAAGLFAVPPYVQLLGSDAFAVSWITSAPATGHIEWAPAGEKPACTRVWSQHNGLRDANSFFHSATVRGADPAAALSIRVCSRPFKTFADYKSTYAGPEESLAFTLGPRVGADGAVSLAMWNDVHQNVPLFERLFPRIGEPPVNFALLNGDIISGTGSQDQVRQQILSPMAGLSAHGLACFYLRGNHEPRGPWARHLGEEMALPDGHFYGAATLGRARFVFLDCGEDKEDSHWAYGGLVDFDSYIAGEVAPWLAAELKKPEWTKAGKRVVAIHIPPKYTDNDWAPPKRLTDHIYSQLKDAGVSLLLGAHVHRWSITKTTPQAPYPMVIGGGPHGRETPTVTRVDVTRAGIHVRLSDEGGKTLGELDC